MWKCSFAVVLLLTLATAARSEDWPEFRGPTGQGTWNGGSLPTEWSRTRNVVWKQAIPGDGWSSPVVVQGRIYLTAGVPIPDSKSLALEALCLDAAKGRVLWQREVFREDPSAPPPQSKNSHASPTPLVRDGRLYVHFGHQGTACLDLTGTILWKCTSVKYQPVHGNGGSPIVVDDKLIFSCDGGDQCFVVALDRADGKVLWKTERPAGAIKKFSFSTPLLIAVNGRKQVVSPGSDAVCAYDPADGREIWRVRYQGYSVIPRPVFGHGLVFLSSSFNSPSLLAIRPDGSGDVTETHVAWKFGKGAPHTPSPLLVGEELYLVSDRGLATCLDAKTGKVHWQERVGDNYSASPLYAAGRVYFQSEEGVGVVVQAGTQFKELARNNLEERTLASYGVADGALFIRTATNLYRIGDR